MRLGVAAAVVAGALVPGDVEIADGRVAAVGVRRRGSGIACAGLVDLQVNGIDGIDLLAADSDAVVEVGLLLARTGVTAYQPTLVTAPAEQTLRALAAIAAAKARGGPGAEILGVHLEGPFLSPERAGAHPIEELCSPSLRLLSELIVAGPVSSMTIAPELDGADGVIDELVRRGVVVSLGHSNASSADAADAFERGARSVTHLFNAMRPISAREPGLAGAALARSGVLLQLIADGVHVADELLGVVLAAAPGRVAVVSDAVAVTLGSADLVVEGGAARRHDGVLAGGVRSVLDGVRRLRDLGLPLAAALVTGTSTPAALLGREADLRPGSPADLVVVDEDALALTRVLRRGEELV
jgi:N-acetylglucosamine-6-phosphate deacetylase